MPYNTRVTSRIPSPVPRLTPSHFTLTALLVLDPDWHSFTSGLCTFCSLPRTVLLWMTDFFASFKCYVCLGEVYIDLHPFKIPAHLMYAPSCSVFVPRCLAPLTCDTIPPVVFFPLEWKPCGNRCVFFVFFPAVFPVPGTVPGR